MVEGIIFDVDGTLLQSMEIWMGMGQRYLKKFGIEAEENLGEILFDLTMEEGAEYLKKNYGLNQTVEEIHQGVNEGIFEFYEKEAMPKEYVKEFLEYVYSKNIPMTIATATDRPMIEAAFKRLGFDKYFKKIFTSTEVGKGKEHPDIFIAAMKEMGSSNENTWLFEDAFYSMKTAKSMGLKNVGIYDFSSTQYQKYVKEMSDFYMEDWKNWKEIIREMGI